MAFYYIPVIAIAVIAAKLHRRKRPRSKAIVVIRGEDTSHISLTVGERLSIQFLEDTGEEWKMTDSPDGFLLGAAKLKWEPAPGDRRLKAFNFSARRVGKTKAEFVKFVESGDPNGTDCSKIEIEIS